MAVGSLRAQPATSDTLGVSCFAPLQLIDWGSAEDAPLFVSLADHCRYRALLHLPGNAYAGEGKAHTLRRRP
jgi:hypothetical protein